jgi:hypothetical protein
MQFCHPQLVRTFPTEREDNFVARRHVHRHLKVVLEWAYQSMHLRSASIKTDRRQLAPQSLARVSQKKETRAVPGPRQRCQTIAGLRCEGPAATTHLADEKLVIDGFSGDQSTIG